MYRLIFVLFFGIIVVSLHSPKSHYDPMASRWELFVRALINIESGGNEKAFNERSGAAGVLQIMPIYVKEANRLLQDDIYTLNCRFDYIKSVSMFYVIQNKYNPNRDIDIAIKLHNPTAGKWYANRVYKEMEKLNNDKDISI